MDGSARGLDATSSGSRAPRGGRDRWDVLVLGELNADLVVRGDVEPRFGQEARLVESADLVLGGSGAIMACGAARLGLHVAYVGLVGDDAVGSFVLGELRAAGVDTSPVVVCPGERSGLGVILSRADGDRAMLTFAGLIPRFRTPHVPVGVTGRARHLHVGAYFLQTGLHAGLPALFASHRRAGGTTSMDPNWDPSGRWATGALLPSLDLLLPNAREVTQLAGEPDVDRAAEVLAAHGPTVVVKRGADGASLHDGGPSRHAPPPTGVVVVETTGAGDSFDAGFVAAYLDGRDPDACLALANACGALSTRAVGGTAAQPSWAEAEALVPDPVGDDRLRHTQSPTKG